jgi:hypothetical protein
MVKRELGSRKKFVKVKKMYNDAEFCVCIYDDREVQVNLSCIDEFSSQSMLFKKDDILTLCKMLKFALKQADNNLNFKK